MTQQTPATQFLKAQGVSFTSKSYIYAPTKGHIGEQAAEAIGAKADMVFKTLVIKLDGQHGAFAVIPVEKHVDFKILATVLGAQKAKMMQPSEAQSRTGFVSGGTTIFGSRQIMPVVIDETAFSNPKIWINGGAQGFLLCLDPHDALQITNAIKAPIAI
ncbi:YbaK/EbsC family protein [Acetobacteraceae bacterium ESL0709]|nr:YbaK/EbsC family protein [Acetobacteraceae bacterium ESL0697]MDF7678791.1 YbaK/EbsC family protein [Acetobacteraceae bacterium ESL0709]